MILKLSIAFASLAVVSILAAFVRRRESTGMAEHSPRPYEMTGTGVTCLQCSTVIKPGREPFAGGLCNTCRKP